VFRLPKKEITEISKISVTSKIFQKYFPLSLRVFGNYGSFRDFLFWISEHTSIYAVLLLFLAEKKTLYKQTGQRQKLLVIMRQIK